jgi:hypothetical protein
MAQLIIWNCFNEPYHAIRPLGAHSIAQWLTHCGFDVHVIDFCHALTTDQLVAITEKNIDKTTVAIGLSITFLFDLDKKIQSEPEWVLNAREKIQTKYPKINWILGGNSFLTQSTVAKIKWKYDWPVIFGKDEENKIYKFLSELTSNDCNESLNYDFLNSKSSYLKKLSLDKNEMLSMELARGCKFKCKFCGFMNIGKKPGTYIKNKHIIESSITENYYNFGINKYIFVDDTVNESEDKIEILADLNNKLPFKIEWGGYNRLDLIGTRPQTVELLKQSGLKSTFFGIESFGKDSSAIIGKGWNGRYGKEWLLKLKEDWGSDISISLSFIVGLTSDKLHELYNTHSWCIKNKMDWWQWGPLYLDRTNKTFTSEFSRNSHEWGYKFTNPMDPTYWENEFWNYDKAVKIADILSSDLGRQHNLKTNTFDFSKFCALGFSIDEILELYSKDIDSKQIDLKFNLFLNNYVYRQLNE